jgi:branched-chain amino acid aminotransferase
VQSCRIVTLEPSFSQAELERACVETVRANGLKSCYLRPLIFIGDGAMGLYAIDNPTHTTIVAWEWGSYLGDDGLNNGITAKVASFARAGVNSMMSRGKLVGQYINSIMAKREVVRAGYQEAILLDPQGYVAEASGENIFIAHEGRVYTPPLGSPILAGITRDTTLALLKEQGVEVVEQRFTRDDLYIADEIFFTGTAAEITPVRAVDDRRIGDGKPGPITKAIQARYFDIVRGAAQDHNDWLAHVEF